MLNFVRIALIAAGGFSAAVAYAATPAESYAQGQVSLATGDLEGALGQFAAAARADRQNQEYMQQYAMLRQAIEIRARLQAEQDPSRWDQLAQSLYAYYVNARLPAEALSLGQQIHQRQGSAQSALMVAETALATGKPELASATLSALGDDASTPACRAMLAVALQRQGKAAAAKRIASGVAVPADATSGTLYSLARMHASVGNVQPAIETLTKCFEATPDSRLEGYKEHARQCQDFAALAGDDAFAKALTTASKVPESKCSGGQSCAGCPMRGKCAHAP